MPCRRVWLRISKDRDQHKLEGDKETHRPPAWSTKMAGEKSSWLRRERTWDSCDSWWGPTSCTTPTNCGSHRRECWCAAPKSQQSPEGC